MTLTAGLYILAALCLCGLALRVVVEDVRNLEIDARLVLVLACGEIGFGLAWPLPGLEAGHAFAGAALGLALATFARAAVHIRRGVPAFGGADVALICGSGGLLGPFLLGHWILLAAGTAIALAFALPLLSRRAHTIEDEELAVLPFCPALILSTALLYPLALTGWIDATLG